MMIRLSWPNLITFQLRRNLFRNLLLAAKPLHETLGRKQTEYLYLHSWRRGQDLNLHVLSHDDLANRWLTIRHTSPKLLGMRNCRRRFHIDNRSRRPFHRSKDEIQFMAICLEGDNPLADNWNWFAEMPFRVYLFYE